MVVSIEHTIIVHTLAEIMCAGFTKEEAAEAGYSETQLKAALRSAKTSGYTFAEAKAAGFSFVQCANAGLIDAFMKKVSSSLEQVKAATRLEWYDRSINDSDCEVIAWLNVRAPGCPGGCPPGAGTCSPNRWLPPP